MEAARQSASTPGAIPPKYSIALFPFNDNLPLLQLDSTRPDGWSTPAFICCRCSHLTGAVYGGLTPGKMASFQDAWQSVLPYTYSPLLPLPILRKSEVVDVDCELNLIDRV